MSAILRSLKSDLLDRRLLPILLVLCLALAGAVAYVVLGSGGSSSSSSSSPVAASAPSPAPVSKGPSLAVAQAPTNPNAALAETTDGVRYRHKAGSHNPFTPLASPKAPAASASTSANSSASSSGSSSSGSPSSSSSSPTSSGGSSTPSQPSTPAPHKPKVVHKLVAVVGVLFGLAPTTPGQLSQLTPYSAVKRLEPLPSASNALVVFEGVSSNRKSAVFTLAREAILKGSATCMPSASQCEAIDLGLGQAEELSYLEPNGLTVTYELALEAIAWHEVTYATAARLDRRNHAGQALLRRLAPSVLSDLHFSSAKGVLVYTAHHGA
jgi:hypothetical protein